MTYSDEIFKSLRFQIIAAFCLASLMMFKNINYAISSLLGSSITIFPLYIFSKVLYNKKYNNRQQIIRQFYIGGLFKFFITMILCVLAMQYCGINLPALIASLLISKLFSYLGFSLFSAPKNYHHRGYQL